MRKNLEGSPSKWWVDMVVNTDFEKFALGLGIEESENRKR